MEKYVVTIVTHFLKPSRSRYSRQAVLMIGLILVAALAACQSSDRQKAAPSPTPMPTPTPTEIPKVNAQIMANAAVLTSENAGPMDHLADLWSGFAEPDSIVFSPDGTLLALSWSSATSLWDIETNSARATLNSGVTNTVRLLAGASAFNSDGTQLAYAADNAVSVWNVSDTGKASATFSFPEEVSGFASKAVAFSPDNALLAVLAASDMEGFRVILWDAKTGANAAVMNNDARCPINRSHRRIAFTPDGQQIVLACDYGRIIVWDVASRQEINVLEKDRTDDSWSSAITPDGKIMATGEADGSIHLWKLPTGELQTVLSGHAQVVVSLAFSPDGKLLASSSYDGTVILWDVLQQKKLASLSNFGAPWASVVVFSPDGRFLVSSDSSGGKLWGVTLSSSQASRSGVKLVVQQGAIPYTTGLNLDTWQAAVPSQWLAPQGVQPRYELRMTSGTTVLEACKYSDVSGGSKVLTREQIFVKVEVADLTTTAVIGSSTL